MPSPSGSISISTRCCGWSVYRIWQQVYRSNLSRNAMGPTVLLAVGRAKVVVQQIKSVGIDDIKDCQSNIDGQRIAQAVVSDLHDQRQGHDDWGQFVGQGMDHPQLMRPLASSKKVSMKASTLLAIQSSLNSIHRIGRRQKHRNGHPVRSPDLVPRLSVLSLPMMALVAARLRLSRLPA